MIDFELIKYSLKVFVIFDLNLFTIDLNQCYSFFGENFQVYYALFNNLKQYLRDNGNQKIIVNVLILKFPKHHVLGFVFMEDGFFQKDFDYLEYFSEFSFIELE